MRQCFFLFFILFNFSYLFGVDYYSSNALGMVLKKISPMVKDTYLWVIKDEFNSNGETRTLYKNGRETKVIKRRKDGGKIIEEEWIEGRLKKESTWQGHFLLRERTFDNKGNATTLNYVWKDDFLNKIKYYKNNTLVFTTHYILAKNGKIQQVRREYPDGKIETTGFQYSGKYLLAEWSSTDNVDTIYRYKRGLLTKIDQYNTNGLFSTRVVTGVAMNQKIIKDSNKNGDKILRKYDSKNRLIYEEFTGKDKGKIIIYTYAGDKLSEKRIKSPGFREDHRYTYNSGGKLSLEKVFQNGDLIKDKILLDNGETEEIFYRNKAVLFKVYYKNGVVVKRE